tara:strand:+ start:102 stop:635 length:534 start_codon:yes stop_codon:yes gene_type:complete
MNFIKNITKLSLYFVIILHLASCGVYRPTNAKEFPPEPEKRVQKNINEGRGFRMFKNESKGGVFDFASSNELWRASLDTLDFMPLISADYGGGIIITDWYNENNNYDDAIKISIRFLTNEIRSDALNVKVYTKKCENLNKCSINENNPEIQNKLISTILSKATKYKADKKKKSRKIN